MLAQSGPLGTASACAPRTARLHYPAVPVAIVSPALGSLRPYSTAIVRSSLCAQRAVGHPMGPRSTPSRRLGLGLRGGGGVPERGECSGGTWRTRRPVRRPQVAPPRGNPIHDRVGADRSQGWPFSWIMAPQYLFGPLRQSARLLGHDRELHLRGGARDQRGHRAIHPSPTGQAI